jgi:hypothetical protein
MTTYEPGTVAARLHSRLVERPSGCIEWTASTDTAGYGQMKVADRLVLVHRLAWSLANGDIPDGLVVMHGCDNRLCCNVSHVSLGTVADNNADRSRKGRSHAQRVTHCPRSHPYSPENTYHYPDGRRECRTCTAAKSRERRAQKRSAA